MTRTVSNALLHQELNRRTADQRLRHAEGDYRLSLGDADMKPVYAFVDRAFWMAVALFLAYPVGVLFGWAFGA